MSEFNMATFHFYLSLLIFLECTYEISNKLVSQVSIRRDWIVVIAEKNAEEYRVVLDWCGAWMLRCLEAQMPRSTSIQDQPALGVYIARTRDLWPRIDDS